MDPSEVVPGFTCEEISESRCETKCWISDGLLKLGIVTSGVIRTKIHAMAKIYLITYKFWVLLPITRSSCSYFSVLGCLWRFFSMFHKGTYCSYGCLFCLWRPITYTRVIDPGGYLSWGLPKESNPFFHSLSSDSKFSFRLIFNLNDVSKDFAYL